MKIEINLISCNVTKYRKNHVLKIFEMKLIKWCSKNKTTSENKIQVQNIHISQILAANFVCNLTILRIVNQN